MNYKSVEFYETDSVKQEILIAFLAEAGFEMFEESEEGLTAFIQENNFDKAKLEQEVISRFAKINYSISRIEQQNWNEVWEKNFEPMQIGDVFIRAPFHESRAGVKYELIIEPKMSFGTGHHATTSLMILQMLKTDFSGKTVLDMGCGTSLLAILASKLGAKNIVAIDIDEWAVENSIENCGRNNVNNIEVVRGDAAAINGRLFDFVLANINRNVLLEDMKVYASSVPPGGQILFSGFYETDQAAIQNEAEKNGFSLLNSDTMNQWAVMRLIKIGV
ncbi:50S ribosomal protein L11 methyltransferase [soil metagenome]